MDPMPTFANVALCLKTDTLSGLEADQKTVGHLALRAHVKTTNEAALGDMGGMSSDVQEAKSKICFEERLKTESA